jgi:hypothetical protein
MPGMELAIPVDGGEDLIAVLDHVGVRRVALVGHSGGGSAATSLAGFHDLGPKTTCFRASRSGIMEFACLPRLVGPFRVGKSG